MSTENSLSTAAESETTTGQNETQDTTSSERSLRDELAAALKLDIDTPTEPVENAPTGAQVEAESEVETPTLAVLEPPTNWPAEQREKFAVLPRETQEWLLNRDKEMVENYTRKTTELAEQRKPVEEITKILEPYKQQMELAGVTPTQAFQRLLAAQRFLETDPSNALKWLAQQYKVDLSSFAPKEEAYVDPDLKALQNEVNSLKSQISQREQQEQQQNSSQVQKQITDFKDARNEDGSLKYPHFDKLGPIMAPLVRDGKTLAEAYDVAKYTLPEVRDHIASEAAKAAQAEALKKAEEQRRAKAKEVKGTTQIVRSRGAAAEEEGKAGTLRQELAKNLAAIQSGRI